MADEHEVERSVSRDEAATALRRLADGVAAGSVSVDAEAGPVAVDVPGNLELEIELEAGDEEVELEAELEWPADGADGSAITELDEGARPAAAPTEQAAALVGPADEPASKARFELFKDAADEWRWRLRHRNGNVIADGGEGYDRKAGAIQGLESVKSNAPHAVVDVQESE